MDYVLKKKKKNKNDLQFLQQHQFASVTSLFLFTQSKITMNMNCNRCLIASNCLSKEDKLYITNCQHILCSICIQKYQSGPQKLCPICKRSNKLMAIDQSLPVHMQMMFIDPIQIGKYLKQSIDFKNKQYQLFSNYNGPKRWEQIHLKMEDKRQQQSTKKNQVLIWKKKIINLKGIVQRMDNVM